MTVERVAIVTGAGRGIGAAVADELAGRGYRLAVLSPSGAPGAVRAHGAVGIAGSVTNPADLAAVVDAALGRFGRIDAVVNSTGHPARGRLLELTDADWLAGLNLLLLNVVRMARLVTPVFLNQGRGSIVNVSTFSAFEPSAAFPVSSTLRAALGSFAKLYADEYAPHGIRDRTPDPDGPSGHAWRDRPDGGLPRGGRCRLHHRSKRPRGRRPHPVGLNTPSGSSALTMYWPASTISEIFKSTHRLART